MKMTASLPSCSGGSPHSGDTVLMESFDEGEQGSGTANRNKNELELLDLLSGCFEAPAVTGGPAVATQTPVGSREGWRCRPEEAVLSSSCLTPCGTGELLGLLSGDFASASHLLPANLSAEAQSPMHVQHSASVDSPPESLASSPPRGGTPTAFSPGNGGHEHHPSIFERHTARVFLAYFRLLLNSRDDLAFLRACDAPERGFGPEGLTAIGEHAVAIGIPMFPAMLSFCAQVKLGGAGYQPNAREPLHAYSEPMRLFARDFEALNCLVLETLGGCLDHAG